MVWGLNNFVNSSILGENWYKAKTGGVVSKTAKSCLLWENSWADTLESGYIMATEYRKEAEKNFTRSTSRISANKYHNICRFCQGQGALLHMLCMCKSSTIIHNTPCVPEHSYYWLEGKWNSWERKQYFHKVDQEKHANRRANIPIMNSEVYQLSPLWTQAISTPLPPTRGEGWMIEHTGAYWGFLLAPFDVLDFDQDGWVTIIKTVNIRMDFVAMLK